ncbi:MAG: hypothetical protein J6Z50_06720 [Fibrobacterales bacterium]|nr:hypothetical protein [Fibrobacterales bacterium]
MKTNRALVLFPLCALLALASCSDSDGSSRNCDADPVPVPEDFTAAGYLALNDDLQSAFALETEEDSLALAKHYCAYGEDEGRLYREGGSSAAGSSSSYQIGECIRTLVPGFHFKFVNGDKLGNVPCVRGWDSTGVLQFFAGDKIVPEGYDCSAAVEVGAHLMNPDGSGDYHNLYLAGDPWAGENIDSTLVEKVVIYTGEETHSSFGGYSSVARPSSAAPSSASGSSSASSGAAHCILNWFTESMFNSYFPNRNRVYTWDAFVEALKKVPDFVCGTAGNDVARQKQELAAVFAHWKQEVADLYYVEEICGANGSCAGNYSESWGGGYTAVPGKYYYGRGAKQISYPGNYGPASEYFFGDKSVLLNDPDRVAREGWLAFATSFWFWTVRGCDQAFWSTGFGATTKIINGGIECGGNYGTQAQARETYYGQYLSKLGVSDSRSKSAGCGGW